MQFYRYPASSSSVTISAVGPNGAAIPSSSILVAGKNPSGNLTPINIDASGNLQVSIGSGGSGLATEATLLQVDADIQAMSAKLPSTLGQKTMSASMSVAIASDQSAVPVSAASLPLPSGAATLAAQNTGNASLASIDSKLTNPLPVSAASLPLPTGAATAANQASVLARLSGSLVPAAFDEIDLTYVPSGNGAGQIATSIYKLAGSTVKTLTMSYNGSNQLTSVIAS